MRNWMYLTGIVISALMIAGCDDDDGTPGDKMCVAKYELDVTVEQRNTPSGIGDANESGLQGQVVLRYPNAGGSSKAPASGGKVEVLNFFFANFLDTEVLGARSVTSVNYFTPECDGHEELEDLTNIPEYCVTEVDDYRTPSARGLYNASSEQVEWDDCDAPADYNKTNAPGYDYSGQANGPGCLQGLRAQGNILCEGAECPVSGWEEGDNPIDHQWNQPLAALQLSKDGQRISLNEQHVPTDLMSNMFVSFTTKSATINCK